MNPLKNILRAAALAVTLLAAFTASAQSGAYILDKVSSKALAAKGITAKFKVSGAGQGLSGTMKMAGSKFTMQTPEGTTWFDGKTLWTLNPRTKEVTVTVPDAAELAEINPMTYLSGYKKQYNVGTARRKDAALHFVVLNPKSRKAPVKAVEIGVSKKTMMPTYFHVRANDDSRVKVDLVSLSYSASHPASTFTFPAAKYKDYEIVDLR